MTAAAVSSIASSSSSSSHGDRLGKIQVLVMDSSETITELFKDILQTLGFSKIYIAHDGQKGAELLKTMRIDLIITDWELRISRNVHNGQSQLVSINGVNFVRSIRFSGKFPLLCVPVIMLMDEVTGKKVEGARDSGVNEIVVKPLNAEELCSRIMAVIDHPRHFVTAMTYKGPCRRRKKNTVPVQEDRRKTEVRIIKYDELQRRSL
ncbi:response regulator [bacterium]|nr:response regulator [bacterium]